MGDPNMNYPDGMRHSDMEPDSMDHGDIAPDRTDHGNDHLAGHRSVRIG